MKKKPTIIEVSSHELDTYHYFVLNTERPREKCALATAFLRGLRRKLKEKTTVVSSETPSR